MPSGWNYKKSLVAGGLVLQDVTHDAFNLAKDIRVTQIWVDTELPASTSGTNRINLELNSVKLPVVAGSVKPLTSPTNPSKFFQAYSTPTGETASFKSKDLYLAGTLNECNIDVTQRYLFGDYGKNPAHEPGGVLDATRLFPLLDFKFPGVSEPKLPYPKYFRADYRLDINLDNVDEAGVAKLLAGASPGNVTTNKAAIFRDKETAPSAILTGLQVAGGLPFPSLSPDVTDLFAALEKPLPFEIASYGLVNGSPPAGLTKDGTWDNVHFWPAKRRITNLSAISTPGAFHAFHCHWRWGAVAGDLSARGLGLLIPNAGDPQFTGVGWTKSAGGPLVDREIWRQNLRFAVTKNDAAWDASKNPSERDFETLFTHQRADPDDIKAGDDLVFWLSFEVYRDDTKPGDPWEGTLFVNGFYFAHNKDNTPITTALAGGYGEAVQPTASKKWERLAR